MPLETAVTVEPPTQERNPRGGLDIGFAVRLLRFSIGLSQLAFAVKLGCPRTYISKIESRKCVPTLNNLELLATALEVPLADFLRIAEVLGTQVPPEPVPGQIDYDKLEEAVCQT